MHWQFKQENLSPALSVFSREITTSLEFEHGNEAKGTLSLLRMLNDCATQPLIKVWISNGNKVKESMVFSSPDYICLKFFREISTWLQNDWHTHAEKWLVNQREEESYVISSDCNGDDAHYDEMHYFIDSEEESIETIITKIKQMK